MPFALTLDARELLTVVLGIFPGTRGPPSGSIRADRQASGSPAREGGSRLARLSDTGHVERWLQIYSRIKP